MGPSVGANVFVFQIEPHEYAPNQIQGAVLATWNVPVFPRLSRSDTVTHLKQLFFWDSADFII